MNNGYCIAVFYLDLNYFTETDEIWAMLPDPAIQWIRSQDFDRFTITQKIDKNKTPRSSVKTEVIIEFLDKELENEFLKNFKNTINNIYDCI
jgi:hypothetical protein